MGVGVATSAVPSGNAHPVCLRAYRRELQVTQRALTPPPMERGGSATDATDRKRTVSWAQVGPNPLHASSVAAATATAPIASPYHKHLESYGGQAPTSATAVATAETATTTGGVEGTGADSAAPSRELPPGNIGTDARTATEASGAGDDSEVPVDSVSDAAADAVSTATAPVGTERLDGPLTAQLTAGPGSPPAAEAERASPGPAAGRPSTASPSPSHARTRAGSPTRRSGRHSAQSRSSEAGERAAEPPEEEEFKELVALETPFPVRASPSPTPPVTTTASSPAALRVAAAAKAAARPPPALLSQAMEQAAMMSSFDYLTLPFRNDDYKWLRDHYPGLTQGTCLGLCEFCCREWVW